MIDVIIVGSGISGCNLYWELIGRGKRVHMISHKKQASSSVAAGVYNPMVLKRFTAVWEGAAQLDVAVAHYKRIEALLSTNLLHEIPVWRRLHDEKEARTWIKKSQREDLSRFMDPDVINESIHGIDAHHGYGLVRETGWLDTLAFMDHTIDHASRGGHFHESEFNYSDLTFNDDSVTYQAMTAGNIVFAEGYVMLNNPYFNDLPLQGNKGEVLTIKVPGLQLNAIIKSSVFLMPYKQDMFWVGATYNRDDLSYIPTKEGLEFLTTRLERFLKLPYEIVDHKAGIRPTTHDRRPFLGRHKAIERALIFNGMGSRAVLVSPWAAQLLCDYMYDDANLPTDIDIKRFHQI